MAKLKENSKILKSTGEETITTVEEVSALLVNKVNGTTKITEGTTAPVNPEIGDLWVDTAV